MANPGGNPDPRKLWISPEKAAIPSHMRSHIERMAPYSHHQSDRERRLETSIMIAVMVIPGIILGWTSLPDWFKLARGASWAAMMLVFLFAIPGLVYLFYIMFENKKMSQSKRWAFSPLILFAAWAISYIITHGMEFH